MQTERRDSWLAMNWFRVVMASCALILGLAAAYYLAVVLPGVKRAEVEVVRRQSQEAARREENAAEERRKALAENKEMLQACLAHAGTAYDDRWESSCKKLSKGKDCSLPARLAEAYDRGHTDSRDECFKQYPVR